ncbi:MAG: chemotaxis protein CheD [Acidobacteria bacterium]|nr:chemotaxis protein CheD [Acidobacteriota bacterium]
MRNSSKFHSIGIGEIGIIREEGSLTIYGLGSCVGLILYDEKARTAGIAHILLPGPRIPQDLTNDLPAKYGDEAIKALLKMIGKENAKDILSLKAGIIGGATIFSSAEESLITIGKRNVEEMRKQLSDLKIKLVWNETGGTIGRSVSFSLPGAELKIRTLNEGWKIIPEIK